MKQRKKISTYIAVTSSKALVNGSLGGEIFERGSRGLVILKHQMFFGLLVYQQPGKPFCPVLSLITYSFLASHASTTSSPPGTEANGQKRIVCAPLRPN